VGERSGGDRIRAVDRRTLSAEELSRDVEGLAADNNDLLAVQELLGDSAGQATEQVTLSVNDDLYTPVLSAIALMTGVFRVQMCALLFAVASPVPDPPLSLHIRWMDRCHVRQARIPTSLLGCSVSDCRERSRSARNSRILCGLQNGRCAVLAVWHASRLPKLVRRVG
jgi:hypothetical protein